MVRSRSPFVLAFLISTPFLAWSQSQTLEDKVAQARAQQASQSMSASDQATLDSLMGERKNDSRQNGGRGNFEARPGVIPSIENQVSDSLLAGPDESRAEIRDSLPADSLAALGKKTGKPSPNGRRTGGKKTPTPPLPKRFEQRIFRNVDRSAFSMGSGAVGRDYVVGPGDEIQVALWGDKEKIYNLLLNKEGKVFLEGVGLVSLAGSNLDEAEKRLRERLGKVYSGIGRGTTHVDVSLGRPGPAKVFVLGEVKVPGGYVFSGHGSILSALYYAQGPTDIGTVRNLLLTRSGVKFNLDLYNYLLKGESLSPNYLQDGDILFAGRADVLVDISGDVGRPATYELRKGEGMKEILEFAGRLNPSAAAHKATLQRFTPAGQVVYIDLASPQDYLSGKAKFELADGDKILIEKSTEPSRNYISVTGPVKYPGSYSSDGVSNVREIIAKAGGLREDAFLGRVHVVRFKPNGSSELMAYSLDTAGVESMPLEPRDNVILYSIKSMYLPDSVDIAGAVFKPGRYEYRQGMSAKDLVMEAGGFLNYHQKGRIVVFRSEPSERQVAQIPLDVQDGLSVSEENFILNPNDFVQIPVDSSRYLKEIVTVEGLVQHPGKYALLYPDERLSSVIKRAGGFKPNAYVEGGRFFRAKDTVGRVGIDIVEAVSRPGKKVDIGMVHGDSIFIPERQSTVKVIGEVGFETSVLYKSGASVQYYIEKAGGFTRRSERDRVVVQYANGETSRDGYFNRKPDAGSTIYVPQGPEPKQIDWIAGTNTILGTLGVTAALLLSIQALTK